MNAKELMIDDLVLYKDTVCCVISIDGYGGLISVENERICDLVPCTELKPIPLTDEILKKIGFIIKSQQAYLLDGIFLDKGLDGNAYWWQIGHCPICAINFVHELQRALRCCGLWDIAEKIKIE